MTDDTTLLVERWRQGDEDAATKLYEQYFERLLRVVSGQLAQRYKAQLEPEDVLQSAFRTVFRRIKGGEFSFDGDGDVWKLLVTVVLNKLRHRIRYLNADRRDIRRDVRPETDSSGYLATQLSQPPGVHEAVEFADLMESVFQFLPDAEKKVLQLRLEGFSQQEIACQLDVTDRTVRRMWERIRDRLGELLDTTAG